MTKLRLFTLLSALFLLPFIAFSQVENCTNGLDDDSDGLIDCFDTECECMGDCEDFYYQTCQIPCTWHPPCDSISLGVQWTNDTDVGNFPCMVAGDLDGDGIPDIVAPRSDGTTLTLIDGKTGQTKWSFDAGVFFTGGTAPVIGDVDKDGFGEIFVVGDDRLVRRYNHLGQLQFIGNQQIGYDNGYRTPVLSLADFDHDGTPELLIGNQIFSVSTGQLLASGGPGTSRGEHPARAGNFSFCSSVAMDVLPDSFCPDCDGLEIVAGNQVLSVNLVNGQILMQVQAAGPFSDGYTSVADFDSDGDLDAIVQGRKSGWNTAFVWDIQTPTVLREYKLPNNFFDAASRINVANFDADPALEVSFVGYPRLFCLDNNFTLKWTRLTNDLSSVTCSSVFDFCGDGSVDIVYRNSYFLAIYEGANGTTKWIDSCGSATHIESPLILDVDGDGQTEIVTTCGAGPGNPGQVVVYEAMNTPGISSRPVWNQHGYFVTNVNDDLTIPTRQQNPHLVGNGLILNGFMNQYFDYRFAAPDLEISFQNLLCDRDSVEISISICNIGHKRMGSGWPVSFYKNNPLTTAAAQFLQKITLPIGLDPDSCQLVSLKIPAIYNDSIFIVLNDDGSKPRPFSLKNDFPSTTIGECNFENNIAGFYKKLLPTALNLGPDTLICDNATLLLQANGTDYAAWIWQNGSPQPTQLVTDAGLFSVKITDICGFEQTDSIVIKIDSSTVVRLGPDREICLGDTLILGQPGFDFYEFTPAAWADCPTCPQAIFSAPVSGNITVEARLANGCFSRDTLAVTVRDTFFQKIDTTICYGRTVVFNGTTLLPDQSENFPFQTQFGCDSTIRFEVLGTLVGTYNYQIDSPVCLGNSFIFNGIAIPPNGFHEFKLKTYLGCDSIFTVKNVPLDTFRTSENRTICAGETSLIFGQPIGQTGTYSMVFTAKNGCDSTHLIHLTVRPPIQISLVSETSCPNEATGKLTAMVAGSSPPFSFDWAFPSGQDLSVLGPIPGGSYPLTVTDAVGCTATATGQVASFPEIIFELETTNPNCFGEKTAEISLQTPDLSLVWTIDGQNFGQDSIFENLGAGVYQLVAQDVNGCTESEVVSLVDPPELLLILPDDAVLKMGDSLALPIVTNSPDSLLFDWLPMKWLDCYDCPLPTARPLEDVRFILKITDPQGCTATDEMLIRVNRAPDIFLPNALKIGGSVGEWEIFTGPQVGQIRWLRVFDRWGSLVHEVLNLPPGSQAAKWDGLVRGKPAAAGVFVVVATLELVDGTVVEVAGDLTVLR